MSVSQDQTWRYRFRDTVHIAMQQMKGLVRSAIDPAMINYDVEAAIDHHERLGNLIANDQIAPFAQTVLLNPEHSRRALTLVSSDATVAISDENKIRGMVNMNSPYTQTILAAINRRWDKHIIDALIGSASVATVTAGTGVIGYGTQTMLAGYQIGGATAMDLSRIINANELLSKGGAPSDGRTMLYSPGQLRDILAITQASSSDFTKNQIHDKGTINGVMWEGFNWIEIADVVSPATTVIGRMLSLPSFRTCIAFHKGAAGVSIGKEIKIDTDMRPDLQSRPEQIRASMMGGSVRVWEGAVVEVRALEN